MDTSKLYLYIIILEYMNNKKVVSAGEVLTTALLNRVSKEAYQFGGFEIDGDFVKKSAFNTEAKTTVIINRFHIKGNIEKFLSDFSETMSAHYYKLKII